MAKTVGNWLIVNIFSVIGLIATFGGLYAGYRVLQYQVDQNDKTSTVIISKLEEHQKDGAKADVEAEHRFTVLEGKMDSIDSKLDRFIVPRNASTSYSSERYTFIQSKEPNEPR